MIYDRIKKCCVRSGIQCINRYKQSVRYLQTMIKSYVQHNYFQKQLDILALFYKHTVQFDGTFYAGSIKDLICIFMNINENLKMRENQLDNPASQELIRPTLNT